MPLLISWEPVSQFRLNLDLKDSKNNSPGNARRNTSKDNDEGRSGRLAKRLESETRDVEDRATLFVLSFIFICKGFSID